MGNEKVLTYLGVELSCDCKNIQTILKKKYKQIGKKKQILNILKPLGIFNRPGVAGAVLQTPSSVIN